MKLLLLAWLLLPMTSLAMTRSEGDGVILYGLWYRSAESVLDVHSYVWWPKRGRVAGRLNGNPVRFQRGSQTYLGDGLYKLLPGPVIVRDGIPFLPQNLSKAQDLSTIPVLEPLLWPQPQKPELLSVKKVNLHYPLRIYIDPGHGGEDSGAVGALGIKEKDITLQIGLATARELERTPSVEVRMSRDDDSYPTLRDRTRDASRWGADLFVSIHCNSAPRKSASGVEVYVVGNISSDRQAERVAAYENRFVETMNDAPKGKVGMILADLSQNDTAQRSLAVASHVLKRIMLLWGGENRGVRQAPFWVLRNATMPSMLLEVGFISNPAEATRLSRIGVQQSYGKLLARTILSSAGLIVKGVANVSR